MHACSTSSCPSAEIVVDRSSVLAVKASPPDVEMARLVALRYGGESPSVPGCLCDGAPSTAFSLWCDHNPIAICLLRENLCFAGRLPEHEHCSGKKTAVNVFMRRDFDRPWATTSESIWFFGFFHFRNSLLPHTMVHPIHWQYSQ